jgi:Ca2+-binding EF-hand superfamily protein
MRRVVIAAALSIGALLDGALAQTPSPVPIVSLPTVSLTARGESIRIELDILVDGHPPTVAWDQFLDRFFDFFDRDNDGALTQTESERMPPLPLPDQKQLTLGFLKLDSDSSGRVSRAELKNFCREGGYTPVVIRVESPSTDDLRLSGVFRQWLDEDRDGMFTANKLWRATRTMSRYDLDEDGALAFDELLGSAAEIPARTKLPSDGTTRAGQRGARLRIKINAPTPAATVAEDATNLLTAVGAASANSVRYRGPQNVWMLAIETHRQFPNVKSAGDFLAAQLQTVLGNRTELALVEIKRDGGLSGLAELAPMADRNGDERLSLAELQSYTELVAAALRSQVWIIVADRDCNLFGLLDSDSDGRLSLVELAKIDEVVGVDPPFTSLPQQFHLSFGSAPIRSWGGLMIPTATKRLQSTVKVDKPGPRWFQALDRNDDGVVSSREFLGPPEAFRQLDRDSDGLIRLDEANASTDR